MMYDHQNQPLLRTQKFFARMLRHGLLSVALAGILPGTGIPGHHILEDLLRSSMMLGGMGAVNLLQTTAGKFYASFYVHFHALFYAFFSGLIFLIMAGGLLALVVHRFLQHSQQADITHKGD